MHELKCSSLVQAINVTLNAVKLITHRLKRHLKLSLLLLSCKQAANYNSLSMVTSS